MKMRTSKGLIGDLEDIVGNIWRWLRTDLGSSFCIRELLRPGSFLELLIAAVLGASCIVKGPLGVLLGDLGVMSNVIVVQVVFGDS